MRNVVLRVALLSFALLLWGRARRRRMRRSSGPTPRTEPRSRPHRSAITFTFNENIGSPAYIAVIAPSGTKVDVGDVRAIDNKVTATLPDVDQKGRYTASYRVVSADGHPVEGTIHFTTTTGRTVKQVDAPDEETFIHRHSAHLFWGILAAAVAIALLLAPLRRPRA